MKKLMLLAILLTGITRAEHALAQNPANAFGIPTDNFRRQFTVELDRGNKMLVAVTNMADLQYISNIDSIVKVFLGELSLIRDSLLPPEASRHIDYNMDNSRIKRLRLIKNDPAAGYYAFIDGAPAVVKMKADTVVIHGRLPIAWLQGSAVYRKKNYGSYFFSVSFYLNDIEDLYGYRDGRLNEKIKIIQQHYKGAWLLREDDMVALKKYPEITSFAAKGYIFNPQFIAIHKSVEIQNYKHYFIPSVSLTPIFIKEGDFVKREFSLSAEAAFSFENRGSTSIKTYVNTFVGIGYHVKPFFKTKQSSKIYPYLNLAFLVHRSGTVYDRQSFRLVAGDFMLAGSTSIQPAIYFNGLFKNVTPSLRIVQRF